MALDPTQPVTMMNFLEYFPDEAGDKAKGRRTYLRYGTEAMKAVHAVGGQLLFAGQVSEVLIEPKGQAAPVQWDDLAAMIEMAADDDPKGCTLAEPRTCARFSQSVQLMFFSSGSAHRRISS